MRLLDLQHELALTGQHLSDRLKEGDTIIFNGLYFSDCTFFTLDKEYKIKRITETLLKVTCNMSFMSINIFPNGLNSFTLKEED